jgi:hypothetical protein
LFWLAESPRDAALLYSAGFCRFGLIYGGRTMAKKKAAKKAAAKKAPAKKKKAAPKRKK